MHALSACSKIKSKKKKEKKSKKERIYNVQGIEIQNDLKQTHA